MPLIRTYLLATLYMLMAVVGHAQYLRTGKYARMEQLEVRTGFQNNAVRPNESFGQKITIHNNSDQSARFRLTMRENKFFKLLYSTSDAISVPAHDSVVVGLKFLNIAARVNGIYTVLIDLDNLDDETDRKSFEFNVEVFDGSDQQFILQPMKENLYLEKNTRDFEVPVMVRNLLPSDTWVRFEIQNASSSYFKLPPNIVKAFKVPGRDTLINLQVMTQSQLMALSQFNNSVTVYLKSDKGDMLGMFTVYPHWLFNTGALFTPGMDLGSAEYYAEARYTAYGRGYSTQDIAFGKTYNNEKDPIAFNMFYQHFMPTRFQVLSNTWLQLRGNNYQAQIGNMADFHELSLFGRGIKGRMDFGDRTDMAVKGYVEGERVNNLEIWGVDGEYNLLSPFSMKRGSKTLSARYNDFNGETGKGFSFSSSYFIRGDVNSAGHLHFGTYRTRIGEKHMLSMLAAVSSEKFTHPTGDSSLPGYALRLEYNYKGNKMQAFLNAYRSSRNYAGTLQGATQINGMMNYLGIKRASLSYVLQAMITDHPGYTDSSIAGRFHYDNIVNAIQIAKDLRRVRLTFKPYFMNQGQLFTMNPMPGPVNRASSPRLMIGVNRYSKDLSLLVSADAGLFTAKIAGTSTTTVPSTRLSMTAGFKGLYWNTIVQQGPYFLSDAILRLNDLGKYMNISTGLSYGKRLFNKVTFNSNLIVNHDLNYRGTQVFFTNTLQIDLGHGFTARGYYTYSNNGVFQNNQFQIGLRKEFDGRTGRNGFVRVHARVFMDKNNNSEKDGDEEWVSGAIFRFEGLNLITGADGSVTINNVEKGFHTIKILYGTSNNQTSIEQKVDVDGNIRMEIPIPPQYELTGRVVEGISKYLRPDESLEGIRIMITRGSREYFVYTQKDGRFRIMLPAGRYVVSIEKLRKLGFADVEKEVYIDPVKGMTGKLELVWQNSERKVEIKKIKNNP